MKFLRRKGLDPEAVIARLSPAEREILRGLVLPTGWYSAEMFARFVGVAAAATRSGDQRECLKEMGRFSAQTNLGPGGLRRAYIRSGDPHHVLEVISRIYRNVYSQGRRSYRRTGERSGVVSGHGTRMAHDHCLWVEGWLHRVVELSGGTGVLVTELQCEGAGDPHCEYRVEWR